MYSPYFPMAKSTWSGDKKMVVLNFSEFLYVIIKEPNVKNDLLNENQRLCFLMKLYIEL